MGDLRRDASHGGGRPPVVEAARRFTRTRRVRRTRIAVGAAVIATAVGVAAALLLSAPFALRSVRIELQLTSTSSLSRGQVSAVVHPPLGRPLVEISTADVAARVRSLPAVDSVRVRRAWPHTLVVDVVARRAALVVDVSGRSWLADSHGVVFAVGSRPDLPVITVPSSDFRPAALTGRSPVAVSPAPGSLIRGDPWPTVARAGAAVASVPQRFRGHARDLRISDGNLTFRLGLTRVVWGDAASPGRKAAALRAFLRPSHRAGVRTVDVSAGGVVVTDGRLPASSHRDTSGR